MRMVSQWQIELAILSLTVSLGLGLFQQGTLSIAEVLLSLLVVVSFGIFMLVKDLRCSVESLAVSMQRLRCSVESLAGGMQGSGKQLASIEKQLARIEKRGINHQMQGHEFRDRLRRWFDEPATEGKCMNWFSHKLASEVSLYRQCLLRNGLEVSLAVLT